MIIRKTKEADIQAAAEIYADAKRFMAETGNPDQWSKIYPSEESIRQDIKDGISYVCEKDGEIVAVFMYKEGVDPTYVKIYDGQWLNDKPYGVIHRIAVKYPGQGIIDYCISYCFELCKNLKIDTHTDNIPMQKALAKRGFKYCGIIYIENGDPRIAFQKSE